MKTTKVAKIIFFFLMNAIFFGEATLYASSHPADTNQDFFIKIDEVTKFSLCVKTGGTSPAGCPPLSDLTSANLTNAKTLWRSGEVYHYDSTKTPPDCWVTGPQPVDNTSPTAALTSPTNGATVSGTLTLSGTASDNVGVTRVEFYRDATNLLGTVTTAPYSWSFNTTTIPNGSHSFTCKAYDAAGNVGTSAS